MGRYYYENRECVWEHSTCWTEFLNYKAGTKITRLTINGVEYVAEGHLSESEIRQWIESIYS